MIVFVAGIHGVGKTYICERIARAGEFEHKSASKLIREERATANWSDDKRVEDVDVNQRALVSAVQRYRMAGTKLLLDGHFTLLDPCGQIVPIDAAVFCALELDGVIIIESDLAVVAQRLVERDGREVSSADLGAMMMAERNQARLVCETLRIPLHILNAPSVNNVEQAVLALSPAVKR